MALTIQPPTPLQSRAGSYPVRVRVNSQATGGQVAEAACRELLSHHRSGEPVGPHLADQLLVPLALAEGGSRAATSFVSQHLLTNAWVVNQFLGPVVSVRGQQGTPGSIVVQGVGRD